MLIAFRKARDVIVEAVIASNRPDKRFARPVYGSADTPCPGTSPERHSHATRIRTIFKNTGWRIPENSLKRSESPEDYHRAIIPYRSYPYFKEVPCRDSGKK